ncbi:MAG TPA: hemolysin [Porphyromonadaceae bacterium]|jgi:CBS domain containing-hemolysin-like protein|nr:hemolysin [Porphyromonadaceae bacterium]HBK31149.1 hemolysin [Porphyromonadaceae bacterium]HBL33400.1 hemolysin [Porphyromonadaceae bacterium]HBX45116.1 hemolysin [Porphyromonadaceae bacterium]HCM19367.1 hemolysin [Porphyromonadaceae bacterium]
MNISTLIGWWIAFMILSMFFSGMEVAFVSSDKLRYAVTKKSAGPFNYMLNTIYTHSHMFMKTLDAGRLVVLVFFIYFTILIGYPYIERKIHPNPLLNYFLIILFATFFILLTGEFFPRAVFKKNADGWVKTFVFPAFIFYVFLYPVTRFFIILSKGILSFFGIRSALSKERELGRVELNSYVRQSIEDMPDQMQVDPEVKIFQNALDFSSTKVRDCMVPRADIVAVSEDTGVETLKQRFIETGISRILVYKDDIDNIIGYIHTWEIINNPEDWTKNIASVSFVPESMQANKLMSDLMQQRKSIAVVVDEFGSTSGIVTIEDLVEEIFGDIEDEYDVKYKFVKQESDNEYVLAGRVEIDQLNEKYHIGLPESDDYSTIAGFLLHHLQRFPKTYETIMIGKFTFKILKVTTRKIEVVRLHIEEVIT